MRRALLAVVILATATLTPAGPARAQSCDGVDVRLVFAVGSGQSLGSREATTFFEKVGERIPETLRSEPELLAYEAVSIDPLLNVVNGRYSRSVSGGVSALLGRLEDAADCDERVIIGGYSQGAHVVGDTMARLPGHLRDTVAFVALFGDPKFNTTPGNWSARGSFAPFPFHTGGSLLPRSPYLPNWLEGRALSYCDGNDFVCTGALAGLVTPAHSEYAKDEIPRAANEIAIATRGLFADDLFTLPIFFSDSDSSALDLLFVIDTTGSMQEDIDTVKVEAEALATEVLDLAADARVALVEYRDYSADDVYATKVNAPFTDEPSVFIDAIRGLSADGGGDYAEALYSGLMAGFQLEWRPGAKKVAIVIGDAPAKNPEFETGYDLELVLQTALELDPVNIYGVPTANADFDAVESFGELADGSDGLLFDSLSGDTLAENLQGAIEEIALEPVAFAGGPYEGRPGTPLSLNAGESFDPDSAIVSYAWDFDNDGTVDQETDQAIASHTYAEPYTGLAVVVVTSDDGGTANATAEVAVTADGPGEPEPLPIPAGVESRPSFDGEVEVRWEPVDAPDGQELISYAVVDEDDQVVGLVEADRTSLAVGPQISGQSVRYGVVARSDRQISRPGAGNETVAFTAPPDDRRGLILAIALPVIAAMALTAGWLLHRRNVVVLD